MNLRLLLESKRLRRYTFIGTIVAICIGLALSAAYAFVLLSRLRDQYLQNLGNDIAATIEAEMRGPGRRGNLRAWKSVLEETLEAEQDKVKFLAVVDQSGQIVLNIQKKLQTGPVASSTPSTTETDSIYLFDQIMPSSLPSQRPMPEPGGWHIHIGLYRSQAAFVMRPAYFHLLIVSLAVLAIVILTFLSSGTLGPFPRLSGVGSPQRDLVTLQRMAGSWAQELRIPLETMRGLTQAIQEGLRLSNPALPAVEPALNEVRRLEKLVGDLMALANPHEPNLKELDLKKLIAEVIRTLQPKLSKDESAIRLVSQSESIPILSDPAGIRQVLLNVLLNAIESTPAGRPISVTVFEDETKHRVVIQVDDSGPGLGGRDPEQLFQPFSNAKGRGLDLGLAIARQIVKSLGGTIGLAELPQEGTRCTLTLPLNRP